MILFHLKIENFRGIRSLEWHPNGRLLCLVGPNNATKTTILEAIELVALSRYNPAITDADFHNADTAKAIVIEATFGDIPTELLDEHSKFGLHLRGYDLAGKKVLPAPIDGAQKALTLRFEVDAGLEPAWYVVSDGGEPKRIPWQDRERLGVNLLGRDVDRHLTWGRGSALSRLTDTQAGAPTTKVVATVSREANRIFQDAPKKELSDAASEVASQAAKYGAQFRDLKPGLDVSGLSFGASAFGLKEANVPSRLWGLGTKRLTALAIQQKGVGEDSILLVDEVETGLEPHRVRHLVDCLRTSGQSRAHGQVLFTTHSPSAVIPLPVECLRFVRNQAGETVISEGEHEHLNILQGFVRKSSHALFARKVLVCEGATEEGMCRGLASYWAAKRDLHPTHMGFLAVNGNGRTEAPKLALELKRIGYDVAVLADADAPLVPDAAALVAARIPAFLWDGNGATEDRVFADLPIALVQTLIQSALDLFGADAVHNQIQALGGVPVVGDSVDGWCVIEGEPEVRTAIGKAAKRGKVEGGEGWFKNVTLGIFLGETIGQALPTIPASPLAAKLAEVEAWIYG